MRTNNPKLFREMSVPYESVEQANESLSAFQAELAELRKKYKIPTLLCIFHVTMLTDDGEEGAAMTTCGMGDMALFESMAAWAFGQEAAARQEYTNKLAASAARIKNGLRE